MTVMTKRVLATTLAILMALAVLLTVLCGQTAAADAPTYLTGAIEMSETPYDGVDYQVKARVWSSTDKNDWTYVSLDDASINAAVTYYDMDGTEIAKPTTEGTYTAKIVLGAGAGVNLQNLSGEQLSAGSAVCSFSYRVVKKGVSVVFAPEKDIAYDGANHHDDIVAGTKVYLDGVDVTDQYTVQVKDEGNVDTLEVIEPATYHVLVKKDENTYTSTFAVHREIADMISLGEATLYEGMYTTYNRGAENPAAEEAVMLANRRAHYTPKFAGSLAKGNGAIADAYVDKLEVTYWAGSVKLEEAPTQAGAYVCRVMVIAAIPAVDLAVGDYVDLAYIIKPTPYVINWNKTADSATGKVTVVQDANGIGVRPTSFALLADASRPLELSVGEPTYLNAAGSVISAAEIAEHNGLVALGQYTVRYTIDLSVGVGGKITGKNFFGEEDKDYVIDANNNEISCAFEIVGPYALTGVRSVYYNNLTEYARDYIAAHQSAVGATSLNPVPKYNSSAAGETAYSIAYTYEGSATFPGGDPVNLANIKDKQLPGKYQATVTFGDWYGTNISGQQVQVTHAGDTAHFAFEIKTVPVEDLSVTADSQAQAEAAIAQLRAKLEVDTTEVTVSYYKYQNGIQKVIGAAAMCDEVGKYAAYVKVTAGEYEGQCYVLAIEKKSTASTDTIKFNFVGLVNDAADYTGAAIAADLDWGDYDPSATAYSLYYQKKADDVWEVCAYPVNPGIYRAVLRFNEPCAYYSVAYGSAIYKQFVIRALNLTAKASFEGDDVYDGGDKEVEITFYLGGKPLSDADTAAFDYTKYYARSSVGTAFTTDKPRHADLYAVGLVFNVGEYAAYGYTATAKTPEEILTAYGAYAGYMLSCEGNLTLNVLRLDALVTLPVGNKALYTGGNVLPTYAFYKGNENKTDGATLVANVTGQSALAAYGDAFDTYFEVASSRTKFGSNIKIEDAVPQETGKYDRLVTVRAAYQDDIAFGRVAVTLDGAEEGETYQANATVVADSAGLKLNAAYSINPLPVRITALDNAIFSQQDDTYVAYYGESEWRNKEDVLFRTVDAAGVEKDLMSDEYADFRDSVKGHIGLTYYTRLTGSDSLSEAVTADGPYLEIVDAKTYFKKGSYTLRITFDAPSDEAEALIYSRYALVGGTDTAAEGLLQAGCYLDVKFDVREAKAMRVVFEPEFSSYTYDGTAKTFNVRFVSGEDDVTDEFLQYAGGLGDYDYKVTYGDGDSAVSNAVGTQNTDTPYRVKVTFIKKNYHYYIDQYVGTYSDAAENIRYIRASSTVTYDFVVTKVRNLSWAFNGNDGKTSFYYNGQPVGVGVDFVSDTTYNAHAATVTLVKGTDYEVWYYEKKKNEGEDTYSYVKLREAPTMAGTYLAEIVFLRDLTDYRYAMDGNGLIVYGYETADANFVPGSAPGTGGYYFGRSLASSGLELGVENRYYNYTVVRPTLRVSGLSAQNKLFDNADTASVSTPNRLTALDGASVVDAKVASLRTLMNQSYRGAFASVGVGENIAVYYRLALGEDLYLVMPHKTLCEDGGVTGIAYVLAQLDAIDQEGLKAETKARIAEVRGVFDDLAAYYDVYYDDVKANITKGTVTVLTKTFSRDYDPDWDRDAEVLTFGLAQADVEKLKALLPAVEEDADFFTGSLTRENADVSSINENGYLIVAGDDFGFIADQVTLSDGTVATLEDLFSIKLTRALYYITPCFIRVGVDGNRVSVVYGDDDPAIEYRVVEGTLRDGDELVFTGTLAEQRKHLKDIDDVGTYAVLFDKVRVYRYGLDVSANYQIATHAAEFVIKPLEVYLYPVFGKDVYYERDAFAPTDVGVRKRTSQGIVGFTDMATKFKASIQYTFGRVEVDNTDPDVYKRYKVTLGTIKMTDEGGNDISANFTFRLDDSTAEYVVRKYTINLVVDSEAPEKHYGDADPYVALADFRHSLADMGFTVAESSKLSREEGEDVGEYKYLANNNAGTIRILDENGEDVTGYCVVSVYEANGTRRLSDYALTINPLPVTVTVRSETVNRTGRSILPEIIYLTSEGTAVSSAVAAKMQVRFAIPGNWEPKEGPNSITPIAIGNLDADVNFEYSMVAGTINVVYPNNVVAVAPLSQDDSIANANKYSFVGGVLYRTVQIYAANTLDGGTPDHTITISLPVTESLYGEDVYIIAVRRDGTYSVREATVDGSDIVIEDDQFYYVLAAQPEYWPYYILAGVVVLILIGVSVAVLRARKRIKVRGKKERPVKEKKAKPAKTNAANAGKGRQAPAAVTPKGDEYAVPELEEDEADGLPEAEESAEDVEALPIEEGGESAKEETAPAEETTDEPVKKEKKSKKEKGKKDKKPAAAAPTGYVPTAVKPTEPKPQVESVETLPVSDDVDTLDIPDTGDDDDITIGGGKSLGGDTIDIGNAGGDDDDEIIISTSSKRIDEDDDA